MSEPLVTDEDREAGGSGGGGVKPGFPTWKYRWFRIRFVEHDPHSVGFGISYDHTPPREVTLTLWRTVLTWRVGTG